MVDIEYETVVGEKDKPMIIVEGTKFHQQKSLANTVVKWIWSTHKTCKCFFLKINENGTMFFRRNVPPIKSCQDKKVM
jgi:hypothetical protein